MLKFFFTISSVLLYLQVVNFNSVLYNVSNLCLLKCVGCGRQGGLRES